MASISALQAATSSGARAFFNRRYPRRSNRKISISLGFCDSALIFAPNSAFCSFWPYLWVGYNAAHIAPRSGIMKSLAREAIQEIIQYVKADRIPGDTSTQQLWLFHPIILYMPRPIWKKQ